MDPLALLSDDDEEGAPSAARPAAEAFGEDEVPSAKRPKALDFAALQRAGYSAGQSDEAEKSAAEASLQSSFAALQEQQQQQQPLAVNPEPKAEETELAEFGCEPPPDSVEVFDDASEEAPAPWLTFAEAEEGLGRELVGALQGAGFEAPTPIQAYAWPVLSAGRDLIGVARTGSGKTLAFLLPFFARLARECSVPRPQVQTQKQAAGPGAYSPEVLVLAPSRELALQIETEARRFGGSAATTLACYGGEGLRRQQLGRLREQPQCVVATVGRLNDFLDSERHWFGVRNVRFLVLDEADHMLGEGLDAPIRKITVDVETPRRQTAMFSATFADEVKDLASWILRFPVEIRVGLKDPLRANRDVEQKVVIVKDDADKDGALKTILRGHRAKVLIFTSEPEECDVLAKKLNTALHGAGVEVLHSNRKQSEREAAMAAFRSGRSMMLVATNVAGRGLDVKDVDLVVNYSPPEDGQDYVHRIGRTARAGRKGTAITLLRKGPDGRAMVYITQVMRRTGKVVPQELVEALKQRRGRDMGLAAEALQGLCSFEKLDRSWAKMI